MFSTLGLMTPLYTPPPMDRLEDVTAKTAIKILAALIVIGGFALALLSGGASAASGIFGPNYAGANLAANQAVGSNYSGSYLDNALGTNGQGNLPPTELIGSTTMSTTTESTGTVLPVGNPLPGSNATQGSPGGSGGLLEFSSDIGIQSSAPPQTASAVAALAYSVGGYVAFQQTYTTSAYIVIRVPAAEYQQVLVKVQAMGHQVSLSSNTNDVRVEFTDLNATLASLRTEQGALLRLLNQSTNINSTLAIESQLQGVNQQINDVESQILQTKTLIDYSTLDVTINETPQQTLPTMTLSASPKSGMAPLSVTFNAVVKGGAQPYVVNYNFGDGYATQGQIVIHTFYQAGDFNVTVSVTDQGGNTTGSWTMIHVAAPSTQGAIGSFVNTISTLFFSVIEGIVEVAVVVLPLAAVGAVVLLPLRRRSRIQKSVKQSQ